MKTYEPCCGDTIQDAVEKTIKMANDVQEPVQMQFNDVTLTIKPGQVAQEYVDFYYIECDRKHEAYLKSPEYAQRVKEAEERQVQKDNALRQAMKAAPEHMTLKDPAGWAKCVENNKDEAYGRAINEYAEMWARLMEGRLSQGWTIADCADSMSHIADTEGITGFMYGCAVKILSAVWIHGEELRRWHNLSTQNGHEGEKANESGGILNPAIMTIG